VVVLLLEGACGEEEGIGANLAAVADKCLCVCVCVCVCGCGWVAVSVGVCVGGWVGGCVCGRR
jgi:hypothetical protein